MSVAVFAALRVVPGDRDKVNLFDAMRVQGRLACLLLVLVAEVHGQGAVEYVEVEYENVEGEVEDGGLASVPDM